MVISPAFLLIPLKLSILSMRVNVPFLSFLSRKSRSTITIGSFGSLIFSPVQEMFHVKHLLTFRLSRKELILVLQQMLQSLLKFMTDFILNHPRISCSIIGVLGALVLIAFVVAINLLGGGIY